MTICNVKWQTKGWLSPLSLSSADLCSVFNTFFFGFTIYYSVIWSHSAHYLNFRENSKLIFCTCYLATLCLFNVISWSHRCLLSAQSRFSPVIPQTVPETEQSLMCFYQNHIPSSIPTFSLHITFTKNKVWKTWFTKCTSLFLCKML